MVAMRPARGSGPVEGDRDMWAFASAVGEDAVAVARDKSERFQKRVGPTVCRRTPVFDSIDFGFGCGEWIDDRAEGGDAQVVQPTADVGQTRCDGAGTDMELDPEPGFVVRRVAVGAELGLEVAGDEPEIGRVVLDGVLDEGPLRVLDRRWRPVAGQPPQGRQHGPNVIAVHAPGDASNRVAAAKAILPRDLPSGGECPARCPELAAGMDAGQRLPSTDLETLVWGVITLESQFGSGESISCSNSFDRVAAIVRSQRPKPGSATSSAACSTRRMFSLVSPARSASDQPRSASSASSAG